MRPMIGRSERGFELATPHATRQAKMVYKSVPHALAKTEDGTAYALPVFIRIGRNHGGATVILLEAPAVRQFVYAGCRLLSCVDAFCDAAPGCWDRAVKTYAERFCKFLCGPSRKIVRGCLGTGMANRQRGQIP
jgi:hypothetical protein